VARALDDAGVVFENNDSTNLAEALAALEAGLARRVSDRVAALRSSPATVKRAHRRRRDDA
jgi:hypothetical protein